MKSARKLPRRVIVSAPHEVPSRWKLRTLWVLLSLAASGFALEHWTEERPEPPSKLAHVSRVQKQTVPPVVFAFSKPASVRKVVVPPEEPSLSTEVVASPPILPRIERKVVTRSIPLADLPVSPKFLKQLEEEGGIAPTVKKVEASRSMAGGSTSEGQNNSGLSPGSYQAISFAPGLTDSGKPIRTVIDLIQINQAVTFPPDYSLDTPVGAKDRLVSLGNGGIITLEVVGGYLTDGPGPDLVVFENPFIINGTNGKEVYAETGVVSVAEINDDAAYTEFPCHKDEKPYRGCAGVVPVRYVPGIPLDEVGGDLFDLSEIGVSRAKYIRIRDTGDNGPAFVEGTEGFDLDAIGLIHTIKDNL